MKSILVICNTYYQLITAIRLKETTWNNDKVDIAISDQSNNSKKVTDNLKKLNIFENVLNIQTKKLCRNRKNICLKILRWKYIISGISYFNITDNLYDEIVYYNPDIFVYGIFAKLIKNNNCLICSRYEEGVLSYTDSLYLDDSYLKYTKFIRKLLHKELLEEHTLNFYCFYPALYSGKLCPVPILQFDNYKKAGKILKKIFEVNAENLEIKEKYIFFTSIFDFEGGESIGEFDLVTKISELVGKENLIIKTHPRDTRNIYEENGFKVYKNSSIPWEAIQLNGDFSDKVFLTVNSGSILGANMMLRDKVKSYFLYNCCHIEKNYVAVSFVKTIEQFMAKSNSVLNKIKIIDNIENLNEICS